MRTSKDVVMMRVEQKCLCGVSGWVPYCCTSIALGFRLRRLCRFWEVDVLIKIISSEQGFEGIGVWR